MKQYKKIIAVVGCLGVMVGASGCANNEVIKKDAALTGNQATTKTAAIPADTKPATPLHKNDDQQTIAPAATTANDQSNKIAVNQGAFDKIYFDFDNADLSKESRDSLTRSAEILMKKRTDVKLKIEGHCDERGSAEYNLALGERRAKSAANYLTTLGVKSERIATISYGKERPAIQGADESAWSKNRRDELVIQ